MQPGERVRAKAERQAMSERAAQDLPGLEKLRASTGQELSKAKAGAELRPELEKGFRETLKTSYKDPAAAEKSFREMVDKKGVSAAVSESQNNPKSLGALKEEPRRPSNLFKDRTQEAARASVHVGPAEGQARQPREVAPDREGGARGRPPSPRWTARSSEHVRLR